MLTCQRNLKTKNKGSAVKQGGAPACKNMKIRKENNMQKQRINVFDLYDVTYETPFTMENFFEVKERVMDSPICKVWNLIFNEILSSAMLKGTWDPFEMPLGEYEERRCKNLPASMIRDGSKDVMSDPDVVQMLNDYGKRFCMDAEVPLMVFRDKETGEIDYRDKATMSKRDIRACNKIINDYTNR